MASILNFTSGEAALANAVVIPVRQDHEGGDITILSGGSGTNILGDVLGYFSSEAPGLGNFYLGTRAGNQGLSSGTDNTAVGFFALAPNTTGQDNTAFGAQALGGNTSASNSTALGAFALGANTMGSNNTARAARRFTSTAPGCSVTHRPRSASRRTWPTWKTSATL